MNKKIGRTWRWRAMQIFTNIFPYLSSVKPSYERITVSTLKRASGKPSFHKKPYAEAKERISAWKDLIWIPYGEVLNGCLFYFAKFNVYFQMCLRLFVEGCAKSFLRKSFVVWLNDCLPRVPVECMFYGVPEAS